MVHFNLSKTEFITYLECPLKFYIMKSMNQGMPYGPRGERDYSDFPDDTLEGMKWHAWFEAFHDDYNEDISNNNPAPKGKTSKESHIMKMFYEREIERFQKNREYWKPLATELYLESDYFRGEIDRIDQLNDQGDCLVIEYKRNKSYYDEQELLFYGCLLEQIGGYVQNINFKINVKEIEIYYYETGEIKRRKIQEGELDSFEKYMKSIIDEIYYLNWARKEDCFILDSSCKYKHICNFIPEGLLSTNEPQKTEE